MILKRVLGAVLVLTFIPSIAAAAVLSDSWQDADIQQLKEAAAKINGRMVELLAENVSAVSETGELVFEGTGSGVIKLPELSELPPVLRFTGTKPDEVYIEGIGTVRRSWSFSVQKDNLVLILPLDGALSDSPGMKHDISFLVTAKYPWKIELMNPSAVGSLDFSGKGTEVSGSFGVSEGGIVPITIEFDGRKYGNDRLTIDLYWKSNGYWNSTAIFSERLEGKGRKDVRNVFANFPVAEVCHYVVTAKPNTTWSITVGDE